MNKSKLIKLVVLVVFFGLGLSLAFFKQKKANDTQAEVLVEENEESGFRPSRSEWEEKEEDLVSGSGSFSAGSGTEENKFTILETKTMTSNVSQAQTGEEVEFSTAIKNNGSKKKHLTHICFNYSGGVTFGCLNKRDLDPGEEIDISNTMMFTAPGTYYVWLTWSQDETNFYRPKDSSTVAVYIK